VKWMLRARPGRCGPGKRGLNLALEGFQVELGPVGGVQVGDQIEDRDEVPVVLGRGRPAR
jgi:hypothetical protein